MLTSAMHRFRRHDLVRRVRPASADRTGVQVPGRLPSREVRRVALR
jgi:hypothetical protein